MEGNRVHKRVPGCGGVIASTAITRHTRDGGVGVEFLDLSPNNLERLAASVDERS